MGERVSKYDTYLIQTTYSCMGTLDGGLGAIQEIRYISSLDVYRGRTGQGDGCWG